MRNDSLIYNLFDYTPSKGDLKKLEITKAAIECLAQVGIEKTTFEAIAKKIGTRRAHVAYHFPEKHKIFLSAVKYVLATFQEEISKSVDQVDNSRDKLTSYVNASFNWMEKYPEQVTVLMLMFYLCALEHDFMDFYSLMRDKEIERLQHLLRSGNSLCDNDRIAFISKTIWNTVHSEIMIIVTNKGKVIEKGRENSLSTLNYLLM
ncbi:MAG: TetR family transcriptional regulator [Bacteriovoracaceae bacterium]|nr:TetR family transcriptional regulator [Bacteriovoracaceae bacterium]